MIKYKTSYIKVQPPRQVVFFEGLRDDLKIGQVLHGGGQPMTIVAVGYHNKVTIGAIYPAALRLTSDEVTSVAYYKE